MSFDPDVFVDECKSLNRANKPQEAITELLRKSIKDSKAVRQALGETPRAIHVYGGNFFAIERSEWDPETLVEHPYDVDKNMALFEVENSILALRLADKH